MCEIISDEKQQRDGVDGGGGKLVVLRIESLVDDRVITEVIPVNVATPQRDDDNDTNIICLFVCCVNVLSLLLLKSCRNGPNFFSFLFFFRTCIQKTSSSIKQTNKIAVIINCIIIYNE